MNARFPSLRSLCRRLGAAILLAPLACNVSASVGSGGATTPPSDAPADAPTANPVEATIDPARMFADLEYLSSDALLGRYTFSPQLGVAADHLAEQYTAMGIDPVGKAYRSPFQAPAGMVAGDEVTVWAESKNSGSRQVPSKELTTLANGGGETAYAVAVAVADLHAAKAKDVRRKVVVALAPALDRRGAAIEALAEHEPSGLVLIGERPPPNGETSRNALSELSMPVVWLSAETAKEWMGVEVSAKGKVKLPAGTKVSMAAKREQEEKETFNVLATIPGAEHPEQIVILGAHYDHIGTSDKGLMCRKKGDDTICNGADDNASGTAMVLEIARAYAKAGYRPSRTLVFAHFAGEELGLHGSKALANTPPKVAPFEGGEVVAMVNLDMVGRYGEDGLAIGGTGSSDQWMPLLEGAEPEGMSIVYERAINGRSDHANFYRKKIPVLFFFTGIHDDYHQAGDHFEKINKDAMAKIGQMVADITRTLADGAEISYTEPRNDDEGVVGRMPGSKDATVERRTIPSAPQ